MAGIWVYCRGGGVEVMGSGKWEVGSGKWEVGSGTENGFTRTRAAAMHYLVIERFRNGDPEPVYRRFAERGRLAPNGLNYVSSWVTDDLTRCYQVMETIDRALLDEWMAAWSDLVEFEVLPVLTSRE